MWPYVGYHCIDEIALVFTFGVCMLVGLCRLGNKEQYIELYSYFKFPSNLRCETPTFRWLFSLFLGDVTPVIASSVPPLNAT